MAGSTKLGFVALMLLRLRWKLLVRSWMHAVTALAALGWVLVLVLAAWLAGIGADRWIEVPDPDRALPQENWPELDEPLRVRFFAEGGLQEGLRRNLWIVEMNRVREASGNAVQPIGESSDRTATTPAEAARWDWVDSHACSLSGWKNGDQRLIAALVRNGVWGCPEWKQAMAGRPLVIRFGLWPGLLLSLLILVASGLMNAWLTIRTRQLRADTRTHHLHYLSQIAD